MIITMHKTMDDVYTMIGRHADKKYVIYVGDDVIVLVLYY